MPSQMKKESEKFWPPELVRGSIVLQTPSNHSRSIKGKKCLVHLMVQAPAILWGKNQKVAFQPVSAVLPAATTLAGSRVATALGTTGTEELLENPPPFFV